MQTKPATSEMIEEWKKTFEEQKQFLTPNRKTGKELNEYFKAHYDAVSINTPKAERVVVENIMKNAPFFEKLPQGKQPDPVTYFVENGRVFVGIDLVTGYFTVEGSERIYDELFAYRGLDEKDLNNFYLVAEYVRCTGRRS